MTKKASKPISKAVKPAAKISAKKSPASQAAKVKKSPKSAATKLLELGLLLDCTSSMGSWITRAKKTLIEIIKNVTASCDGLKVRVCFVGYRDHCDTERFSIYDFTDDLEKVKNHISNVQAIGGGDIPEDVVGGLRKCLD